ncbi:MAG: glycosyltransferase family 2 protein [Campylobacterales bacterium]|nr:glycosyltransferase family 2 protein [Campylobacterales bacterium]
MKITVFTPTYNRRHTLNKLYRSLQKQNYRNFEWLVIDDGSTDNTFELFEEWTKENSGFEIRFFRIDNGGKHRAINKGGELAKGELFFIVDSDDYLTEDSLQSIIEWENTIDDKDSYCALAGNKGRSVDTIVGSTFKGEYIDATSLERYELNITGDKAEVFYTEVLKRYKFDEIEGETFITERTVWDRMAFDGLNVRWFNKIIYLCEYLEDGLTRSGDELYSNNPKGTAIAFKQMMKFNDVSIKDRLVMYYSYYSLVENKICLEEAARNLEIRPSMLWFVFYMGKIKMLLNKRRKSF